MEEKSYGDILDSMDDAIGNLATFIDISEDVIEGINDAKLRSKIEAIVSAQSQSVETLRRVALEIRRSPQQS